MLDINYIVNTQQTHNDKQNVMIMMKWPYNIIKNHITINHLIYTHVTHIYTVECFSCISQTLTSSYASVDGAPEAYGSQFVCVCVCVTLQLGFLEAHNKLSADTCNIGTMRQYLKAKGLRFLIFKAVF